LLFFYQDYEEAILLLLEGASWEEALRLVREFLKSPYCVLSRKRARDTTSARVPYGLSEQN
jgi:hypothetical protein